jgi:site-specific DNA-cytosine methylase
MLVIFQAGGIFNMKITAAVINAGLGDISLGLKKAGFEVVAAFEKDEKALATHKTNLDVPVYQFSPEEIDVNSFPEIDLVAARWYCQSFSAAIRVPQADPDLVPSKLHEILLTRRPRAFFLLINASSNRNERLRMLMDAIYKIGYQCELRDIDVAQETGLPVVERMVCMVGTLQSIERPFQFPKHEHSGLKLLPPEHYIQWKQAVDSWYYRLGPRDIIRNGSEKPFYCWKNHGYVEADRVQWNTMKIPLINTGKAPRKITHREIASLKGFPTSCFLPDDKNRTWLYQKLMYANNVLVVKQIADMLNYILADNPWRSQQAGREDLLECLVESYLANMASMSEIERHPRIKNQVVDFALHLGNRNLYFEVKYYRGSVAPTSRVKAVCASLSPLKEDGLPILILANEIPQSVKQQCLEQFGVSIWDVGNLLWYFNQLAEIKNEFVALLDYSTEHIEPQPPEPDIIQKVPIEEKHELSWEEKLDDIAPGLEKFKEYEEVCVDILKYILGDYLTLWKTQESTTGGLYRFDLCCKIKNGTNQDFFDTIKHNFNTKYIVFEFKNYDKKISQKEIYTTEKYLYENALRKVAILITRSGADEHALQAVRGSLREAGKLILCLSDNNLLEMIDIKMRGEEPADFLGAMLDNILVHLEK